MNDNFDEINKYVFELHLAQQQNTSCINHKINLFGFTTIT